MSIHTNVYLHHFVFGVFNFIFYALGLSMEYMERGSLYRFIRKLLCLPFLPAEHTEPTFETLVDLAPDHHLNRLTDYVRRTWFESTVWAPDNWSIFRQSVRTNNDVEGNLLNSLF